LKGKKWSSIANVVLVFMDPSGPCNCTVSVVLISLRTLSGFFFVLTNSSLVGIVPPSHPILIHKPKLTTFQKNGYFVVFPYLLSHVSKVLELLWCSRLVHSNVSMTNAMLQHIKLAKKQNQIILLIVSFNQTNF